MLSSKHKEVNANYLLKYDVLLKLPVRNQPVDGREMFALCQFLIKAPEHLHDTQCGRGNRVREVSSRR
jgi:hypothetical protein